MEKMQLNSYRRFGNVGQIMEHYYIVCVCAAFGVNVDSESHLIHNKQLEPYFVRVRRSHR